MTSLAGQVVGVLFLIALIIVVAILFDDLVTYRD